MRVKNKFNIYRRLTWSQYNVMLTKAKMMEGLRPEIEWQHRWSMVQLRILTAMTNPVIFFR